MLLLGVDYVNQGVLVVFHINYNHFVAVPKACWREEEGCVRTGETLWRV